MYDKVKSHILYMGFQYESTIAYWIQPCTPGSSRTSLPVQPMGKGEKIWTFTKTETAMIITCNGVDVLNYQFSDSSETNCVPELGRDVEYIRSYGADTYYRASKDINSKCSVVSSMHYIRSFNIGCEWSVMQKRHY